MVVAAAAGGLVDLLHPTRRPGRRADVEAVNLARQAAELLPRPPACQTPLVRCGASSTSKPSRSCRAPRAGGDRSRASQYRSRGPVDTAYHVELDGPGLGVDGIRAQGTTRHSAAPVHHQLNLHGHGKILNASTLARGRQRSRPISRSAGIQDVNRASLAPRETRRRTHNVHLEPQLIKTCGLWPRTERSHAQAGRASRSHCPSVTAPHIGHRGVRTPSLNLSKADLALLVAACHERHPAGLGLTPSRLACSRSSTHEREETGRRLGISGPSTQRSPAQRPPRPGCPSRITPSPPSRCGPRGGLLLLHGLLQFPDAKALSLTGKGS